MFNRIQNYMQGRNGFDALSGFLLICAIVVDAFSCILRIMHLFALAIFGIALWRIFSKDIAKRRAENYKFKNIKDDIQDAFEKHKFNRQQKKQFRFFNCPNCKNCLRVPRGKGTINITCPKCGTKFTKTT